MGSGSTKVTVRMGPHVFLSAVRMGHWYCTDGTSWAPVQLLLFSMLERCPKLVTRILFDIVELKLDTFMSEVSKNKFRTQIPMRIPLASELSTIPKKNAAFNFEGLLAITIRTVWCKQLLSIYQILHELFQYHQNLNIGVEIWNSLCIQNISAYELKNLGFVHSLFKYELSFKNLAE